MSTYTFRRINNFNITEPLTFNKSKNSSIEYGSVTPLPDTIEFANQTWSIFQAVQKKKHNNIIYIDETPYDNYESRRKP